MAFWLLAAGFWILLATVAGLFVNVRSLNRHVERLERDRHIAELERELLPVLPSEGSPLRHVLAALVGLWVADRYRR